MMGSAVTRS